MRFSRAGRVAAFGAVLVGAAAVLYWQALGDSPPARAIPVLETRLDEASGLAPAGRTADLLWAVNDSYGEPLVYAVGTDGRRLGALRVQGATNVDWEALAAFPHAGRFWLAVADVGDNGANRRTGAIHFVEEPSAAELLPGRELTVRPERSLTFRYEDGPRDCEAMLVDPKRGEILLISKRYSPPVLYRLPLAPASAGGKLTVARKVGPIRGIPRPNSWQRLLPTPVGRYRAQPTDAALSPDGRQVALLTYGGVYLYQRHDDTSWEQVFLQPGRALSFHGLGQAEAVAFAADGGTLYVTGEQARPVLVPYPIAEDN